MAELEARGRCAPPEGEEPGQRCSGAGGAGRHVREAGGSAPQRLAQDARHRQPRALVYQRTWVLLSNGMLCWLRGGVAGAWGRRSWLGDAAGPAPRLPVALLPGQQGCSHCGLPVQSAALAGKPHCEFRALPEPHDEVFPPRNTAFKPGLGSLIRIQKIKPPASLPPGGSARPGCAAASSGAHLRRSHTQWHTTSWPRGGLAPCVVCALVPLFLMLPDHMCPSPRLTALPTFK